MAEDLALPSLPPTQREILRQLKLGHELPTEELARRVFITPGAVRHHLALLHRAGYVSYRPQADGRGRPRFIYSLTSEGEALFPTAYEDLALRLLAGLQKLPPSALSDILSHSTEVRLAFTRVQPGTPLRERARVVAKVLEDEGYMPAADTAESLTEMTLNHCPILAAARAEPALCSAERAYIERALGTSVERTEFRLEGGRLCRYLVRTGEAGEPPGSGGAVAQ
ncbi:MAG: helix-turn-helix transcriptional regulator [Hyphomicrobiales bacterium]